MFYQLDVSKDPGSWSKVKLMVSGQWRGAPFDPEIHQSLQMSVSKAKASFSKNWVALTRNGGCV